MASSISTDIVQEHNRFEFWRDLVCDKIIHLDIERVFPDKPFFGSIKTGLLGNLQLAAVHSIAQKARRSGHQIAEANEDKALFCFQLTGKAFLLHDGRAEEVLPGDWAYCDTTRPFQWSFPDRHIQLALKLSRHSLLKYAALPAVMPVRAFSGKQGLGGVVFDMVTSIWNQADHIHNHQIEVLERIVAELLATVLHEQLAAPAKGARSRMVRLVEAKAKIRQQLDDPNLSVASIAHQLKVSVRYLHFLFNTEGTTVGRYIRERRLEKCKHDLGNPLLKDRSITEILYSRGFNDSSHFSKLFKKRYGLSPRQCRFMS